MKCPKCEAELVARVVRGVEVDQCDRCRGIWFDPSELGALLRLDSADLKPLRRGRPDSGLNEKLARCPRDGVDMVRVISARDHTTVLDSCLTCRGIWLDGGEFEALRRAAADR